MIQKDEKAWVEYGGVIFKSYLKNNASQIMNSIILVVIRWRFYKIEDVDDIHANNNHCFIW